jgi:hypothetical protein
MPPPSTFRYLTDYSIDLEKSEAVSTYYAGDQRIPDMFTVDRPDMYRLRQPGTRPASVLPTNNNNNNNNNQVPSDPFSANTPDANNDFQVQAQTSETVAPAQGPLKPALWSIQGLTDKKLPVRFTAYQTGEITHVAIDNDHWVIDKFVDMSGWFVFRFALPEPFLTVVLLRDRTSIANSKAIQGMLPPDTFCSYAGSFDDGLFIVVAAFVPSGC